MTPEQFIFWLAGYLSCCDGKDSKIYKDISNVVKEIKNSDINNYIYIGPTI